LAVMESLQGLYCLTGQAGRNFGDLIR